MDTRIARDSSLLSRHRPLAALLLIVVVFGLLPAFAAPGQPHNGDFQGRLTAVPITVRTDAGPRASTMDLDLVLDIGPGARGRRAVSVHDAALAARGVATGAGASGDLDGDLHASATAPLGADGRVSLSLAVDVRYPLIDRVFPPSPEPFRETFGGTLNGTLAFAPQDNAWLFNGTLHLDAKGAATGKVLSLDLPLEDVEFLPAAR
jgi:hypothetical protein